MKVSEDGAVMQARRATIYDVAARAHVSAQTVSRVVNAAAGVAPGTRERVQVAIRELGYQPDTAARALKSGRSQRIGVLAHQMAATGPSGNTAAALAELRAAGYDLDIVALPEDTDEEMIQNLVAQAMAGFARSACAVMAMAQTEAVRAAVLVARLQVPVYLDAYLDRGSPTTPGAEELVGRAAAAHLLGLGHGVLAHLPGPVGSLSGRYRQESFQEAIYGAGATCEIWPAGDWSATSGHHVASRAEVGAATALFVSNDAMAIGALSALQARGFAVPADLAVMGTDDIAEAAYTSPALTSVHHDTAAEGRLAARVLLADLHGLPHPDTAEALQVHVRVRASTAGESRDRYQEVVIDNRSAGPWRALASAPRDRSADGRRDRGLDALSVARQRRL